MSEPKKIPLLFTTDFGTTGFGEVGRQLMQRLAFTKLFDIHYLGWWYNGNQQGRQVADALGFKLITTAFWDQGDVYGAKTWDSVIDGVRPKIVLSLGDPWMVEHIGTSSKRNRYQWVCYMPIDRDPISKPWLSILKQPDVLVLYSEYGMAIVNEQMPFRNPQFIPHGVDKSVYKPLQFKENPEMPLEQRKRELKRRTIGEDVKDSFIVGFVGRNQVRKAIPRHVAAFKAFNCDTWVNRREVVIHNDDGTVKDKFENTEDFCSKKQCFRCDVCPAFRQRPETANAMLYL